MIYAYVELSPHMCRGCDKRMMLILTEDDDGENRHLEHWCDCGNQFPDDVWRIDIARTHREVEAAMALTKADAAVLLAGLGVSARERMEARLA